MITNSFSDYPDVRVVIALPNLAAGGAQTQGLILARDLLEKGIPTGVFLTHSAVATYSNQELSQGIPILYSQDVPVRKPFVEIFDRAVLDMATRIGAHPLTSLLKRRLSARILRDFDLPDTVQDCLRTNLKIGLAARSLRAFLEKNKRTIVISLLPQTNIASIIAAVPLTYVAVIERNDFDRQEIGGGIRHAQMLLYPRANLIGANSRNAMQQMSAHFPDQSVHFIPNAYRPGHTLRLDSSTEKLILVVGRLEKQKRPLEVLRACIDSNVFSQGWKVAFAGSGTLEDQVRGLLASMPKYRNRVLLLGHLKTHEIPYSRAAFCIVNSDYEGSPNVLAESLSFGVIPLVRESVSEFREFIPPEFQHSLVFDNVDSLTKILSNIAALSDKQAEIRDGLTHHFNLRLKEYSIERDEFLQLITRETRSRD